MNQEFNLNRWLLLIGKHWSENRKKYLLSLVAMAGLLLIWFSFMMIVERGHPQFETQQGVIYFIGLYLVGCLYGNMLFADLSGGPKGIHYLSVPASALEKLLTALLFGVVLFFIAWTVIFYLVDIPMMKLANSVAADFWKEHSLNSDFKPRDVVNVFNIASHEFSQPFYILLRVYFPVQSAFILGSIYFIRFSFIKTTISLFVVFLAVAFFLAKVLHGMLPYGDFYGDLTGYRLQDGYEQGKIVKLPDWAGSTVVFLFKYAFAPIFWVAAYFRLKEKEI